MSLVSLLVAAEEEGGHADPSVTHHWLLPETAEIIYGGLASVLIFAALYKFGLPLIKKGLADRTARIQKELDGAAAAKSAAATEAAQIRSAKGDIEAERARLLAEADAQAAQLVSDGRSRLAAEIADLEVKADADIVALGARSGDELRAEVARHASSATDVLVRGSLDEAAHQRLIESFIAKVGAGK